MPTIAGLEEESRLSFPLSPFSSNSAAVYIPHRRSFSYYRLPVHLLKLTVLKLDGSSFDVQVARTASVRELKMAVEEVFGQSQMDRAIESISWAHVWGQFCLSYRGFKLIEEKALLKNFAIKDGDQLQFVRHLSISFTPIKQRCRGQETKAEWRRKSWSGTELVDFKLYESTTETKRNREPTPVINEDTSQSMEEWVAIDVREEESLDVKNHWQFKLSRYLKGFLCYYYNPIYMTRERYVALGGPGWLIGIGRNLWFAELALFYFCVWHWFSWSLDGFCSDFLVTLDQVVLELQNEVFLLPVNDWLRSWGSFLYSCMCKVCIQAIMIVLLRVSRLDGSLASQILHFYLILHLRLLFLIRLGATSGLSFSCTALTDS